MYFFSYKYVRFSPKEVPFKAHIGMFRAHKFCSEKISGLNLFIIQTKPAKNKTKMDEMNARFP